MARIHLTRTQSALDQLEELHRRIAERAYSLFTQRNGFGSDPLDDWLSAERELVWKPAIEMREEDGALVVQAALPGADAKDITVTVSPSDLVVKADVEHRQTHDNGTIHRCELFSGEAFRSLEWPKPVDVTKVTADYQNGMLRITAPLAPEAQSRRIGVTAA